MSRLVQALVHGLAAAALLVAPPPVEAGDRFSFALLGDTPYFRFEEHGFASLLAALDAERLAFVVHVGDFKQARAPCSDALFLARRNGFDASRHPFIYLPGDNDWTDCHASGSDPLDRLAALRRLFHAGDQSLGRRRLALTRQSGDARFAEFRENVRWIHGAVLFVGLNVPGSNNNLGRSTAMDAEHHRRMAAVFAWLDESFRLAERRRVAGVVLLFHANPNFEGNAPRPRGAPDGFTALREVLRAQAVSSGRPILLAHGDTHAFRHDQPLRDPATGMAIARFARLEVPGSPAAAPVTVDVDPANPTPFTVRPPETERAFADNP